MQKIKVNDEVIVIAGKDRGKTGQVKTVLAERIVVAGINLVKKHMKPNPNKGIDGGIVQREMGLHISNVAPYNSVSKKRDRIRFQAVDGVKVRVFKSNNERV